MGSETFVKNQYALEVTRGTPVTVATKRWWGQATIPVDRTPQHPKYTLGVRAQSGHTEIRKILADPVNLTVDDGYYQALPMLLGTLMKGGITPTEQTTGKGDYLWDFTPSLTAANNPDTITLQTGDNDQCYLIEYLMGKKLTLDFDSDADADVKLAWEGFGRQVSKGTFTASINTPTVLEPILASSGQIWIDPAWASLGTTAKTNLLRSGTVEIGTGNHPKNNSTGNKTFGTHAEGYIYAACKFVLEGGADAIAAYDAYLAGTPKAIRLKWTGGLIPGPGLAYSLTIDMFGAFDEVRPLDGFKDTNTLYGAVFSTLTDLQATQHALAVKLSVNQQVY
jgi:hypothetical protein